MARKKHDSGGGYSWMDTYGDMVTLLLTFFIMLFSMSTVNEDKWKILVQAFSMTASGTPQQVVIANSSVGDQVMPSNGEDELNFGEPDIINDLPVDLNQLYDYLKAYIEENEMAGSVSIEQDAAKNVYIRFDNNIFFDGDSSVLRRESYPIMDFMGKCISNVESQILMVRVNGHTAEVKGSSVSDWDLSALRATHIVSYFDETVGFPPKKLMCNGYGKNFPRDTNDTPEGRAKNRRVEIMIIGNEIDGASAEQLKAVLNKVLSADTIDDATAPGTIVVPDMNGNSAVQSEPAKNENDTNSAVAQGAGSTSNYTVPEPKPKENGNNVADSIKVAVSGKN
ncbi:MAG: flagellar motor protein MotB [Oscillospiraceae bacterium]